MMIGDVLDQADLKEALMPQVADLSHAITPTGIGFSDYFTHDGDNSAAALSIVKHFEMGLDATLIQRFGTAEHFWGYIGELQVSHTVTSRSVYLLDMLGISTTTHEEYLLSLQMEDGSWPGDKWNISPYYGTCIAAFALAQKGYTYKDSLKKAVDFIQDSQLEDGGWSIDDRSAVTDTSYALLALYQLDKVVEVDRDVLNQGYQWITSHYRPFCRHDENRWLNKLEYTPYRIDWAFLLTSIVVLSEKFPV